jgi:hypothetical protein
MSAIPRSRGALSGVLLILLGAWGGLVPFAGPYFHYAYTPDTAWHFTLARLWLEILPGAAAVVGGALVTVSTRRLVAGGGAILAALGGAWFTLGNVLGPIWTGTGTTAGTPVGGSVARAAEQIGLFTGLGVVIVFLAAMALGRFSVAAFPGQETGTATGSVPAEADTAPAATSSFPANMAGSPADSGSFPARSDDRPGGPG